MGQKAPAPGFRFLERVLWERGKGKGQEDGPESRDQHWGFVLSLGMLGYAAEPPALARLSGAEKERVAKLIEGPKRKANW